MLVSKYCKLVFEFQNMADLKEFFSYFLSFFAKIETLDPFCSELFIAPVAQLSQ